MNNTLLRSAGAFVAGAAVTVLLQVLVIHGSPTTTVISAIAVGIAAVLAVSASRRGSSQDGKPAADRPIPRATGERGESEL